MSLTFQKIIVVILIILAVSSIYLGSYLPFGKSERYISAMSAAGSAKSLQEFEANYDNVFKFYSPIGQEEVVKFFGNDVMSLLNQANQPEAVARALADYIEPMLLENNVRHVIMGGNMYLSLWYNYGRKDADFRKVEDYYLKAYAIGPKLPPVLYGLLNAYLLKDDKAKIQEFGNIILSYWPKDQSVQGYIDKARGL
ncbi:MAG: hypothetical protein UY23_C0001G0105 [Candidatus Jorgensenbacteria bacterium GW2011_GWA1_48_11]|uniref:Uncharacterized protein n=1 Tax=Candidatus Jorgensenbacteria bacterium GW2011_GWA1_48_11 TaxID=1618660 RepID=A0A0G1UBK4_9BACT|nr:MAG: hypothetical protein UY23_C0001G0105 [Candidatus Jorgensenbacteria bacterium GW2011_GWA1_48_11]KKW11992.1 MAG: hypothetical protein UY51_C0005G0234 [Candidatus Jorgensenbacteria bacterium GW2011_GWB1_49_9]